MTLSTDAVEDWCAPSFHTMACLQSKLDVGESLPLLCLSSVTDFDISAINGLLSGSSSIVGDISAHWGDCIKAIRSQGPTYLLTAQQGAE